MRITTQLYIIIAIHILLLQGSHHKIVSRRDTLTRHDLVNVADDLCFDSHSSEKVTELAVKLGIPEADIHTLKRMAASDDFPLVILLEWKKRQTVASRPQLAGALVSCGLKAIAMKLDSNGKRNTIQNFLFWLQFVAPPLT